MLQTVAWYSMYFIGLDFWLYSIQTRAPRSPVLVVGTHIDEVSYEYVYFPQRALQNKYPQIKGFFGISCKTRHGIDELKAHLIQVAESAPHIHIKGAISSP